MDESGSPSSVRIVPAAGPAVPGVGKYRYIATLDEGGMADVYLGVTKDTGFEKIVVIKQLREALSEDPTFVAMFMDEARLAARLNHPNVVQTLEVGTDQGVHYLAMEFLEGVPYVRLARMKERIPAPLAFHVRVLVEVLHGLHYAHELRDFDKRPLGVVHRDVSPHNVMITFEGNVKVLDFGIAKAALAAEQRPEDFKGKLEYMSPEQALLMPLDRRADIYSVGVMLWEALTRERFYPRGVDKFRRLTEGTAPDVLEVAPIAPKKLARICMRALARDPQERFATAGDMAEELEAWLGETGQYVTARDVGVYVAEKFDERRTKLARAISTQLERFRTLGAQSTMDLTRIALDAQATGAHRALPITPVPKAGTTPAQIAIICVAIALAGISAAVWVVARARARPPIAAAPAASTTPPAIGAAQADSEIELTVRATPASATIFVDGQPQDSNPAIGKRPRDGAIHVVRVEAPGYEPREESVGFDRSFLVTIELHPSPTAPIPAKTSRPRSKGSRTGKPPGSSGGSLDGENPYQ